MSETPQSHAPPREPDPNRLPRRSGNRLRFAPRLFTPSVAFLIAALVCGRSIAQPNDVEDPESGQNALRSSVLCDAQWAEDFGLPGVGGWVHALTTFDDGTGSALYVGGSFSIPGPNWPRSIAKWDGTSWAGLGEGVNEWVISLAVFDDGTGPALYAGGYFTEAGGIPVNNIAKWDGASWTEVGDGFDDAVYALTVHDDGGGPTLYAGGRFTSSGGAPMNRIAKWNGTEWIALGSGVDDEVWALESSDLGTGPELYVGGQFHEAGGDPSRGIARWDGASWSPLAAGVDYSVYALKQFDDGSGAKLFVGGAFYNAGGTQAKALAAWDGSSWFAFDMSLTDMYYGPEVWSLEVHDDGTGPALFVGGTFDTAGTVPANNVAKWDGTTWSAMGEGVHGLRYGPAVPWVYALTGFDDGSGSKLYLGGEFLRTGTTYVGNIAQWGGSALSQLGPPMNTASGEVYEFTVFDDGNGTALYVGGGITGAGGVSGNFLKWDGSSWSTVEGWIGERVFAVTVFDDGSGADLYVGGRFGIAKRDGGAWSSVGGNVSGGSIEHLTVFDDGNGPALYAGGHFSSAGGVPANRIAKWDGISWSPLGNGADSMVYSMIGFDDGTGPALYAIGYFSSPGRHIAKWDGNSWSRLGSGIQSLVWAIAGFDDGTGPALYVGGRFAAAGGVPANRIAKWDGDNWSPVGSGVSGISVSGEVNALTVYDDGSGSALYAGGLFTTASGVPTNGIAKWNGTYWSSVGGGMGGAYPYVYVFSEFDDGTGPALYAGGVFSNAGYVSSSTMAKWWNPPAPCSEEPCIYHTEPPDPEPILVAKNRYLTIVPKNPGSLTALRVTPVSLPGEYAIWNDSALWVSTPKEVTELSGSNDSTTEPTFTIASLSCQPVCRDWSELGTVDVYGEAIIPGAEYLVHAIDCRCDFGTEEDYSQALPLTTSSFGDIVGNLDNASCWWTAPNGSTSIPFDTIGDIDKFRNVPCAPRKARADLVGDLFNRSCVDQIVSVFDYLVTIDGFRGLPYPFSPSDPNPCNATPCPEP